MGKRERKVLTHRVRGRDFSNRQRGRGDVPCGGNHEVRIESAVPYNMSSIFSTSPFPPEVLYQGTFQARYADVTLTKIKAAGTADSWTSVTFVPRAGTKVLPTAYGKEYIISASCIQKFFFIRNLGAYGVEVRVQGGGFPEVTLGLEAQGLAGYVLDPDIHVVGSSSENFVSIAAGASAVLETGVPGGIYRLQARVAGANSPLDASELIIEYGGFTLAMR